MAVPMAAFTFFRSCRHSSAVNSCFRRCLHVTSSQGQEAAVQQASEQIEIPRRKQRNPTAVLEALSRTVNRDPTAAPYGFHDDAYLLPKNGGERGHLHIVLWESSPYTLRFSRYFHPKRRYLLAADAGRQAAEHVIGRWPEHFLAVQDDAPKVEAFYPPQKQYVFNDPTEEAILERIDNSDSKMALDMFYQTLQSGTEICLAVSNALLDLLCYHGYHEALPPVEDQTAPSEDDKPADDAPTQEQPEQNEATDKGRRSHQRKSGTPPRWKDDNDIEKLFNSLPERDADSYCAMIRGMIKHGAANKAFILYNEMQERGVQATVEAYNALIGGAVYIRDDYRERWKVIYQLMNQMRLESVPPNLDTFNRLLDSLRIMGTIGRKKALQTLPEMRAVGVEPSLGTYNVLLMIFYKDSLPPTDVIYDIMDTIEGQSFTLKHKYDIFFFKNAMNICLNLKDIELAYRVDVLLNTGDNFKLAGDYYLQNIYYGKFFHLICVMDSVDNMFEYYEKLVPSALIPSSGVYIEILRSLETAQRYGRILDIWKDVCHFGHQHHQPLLDQFLSLMALADATDEKILSEFLGIAMEIKAAVTKSKSTRQPVQWSASSLTQLTRICLRAGDLAKAWNVVELFKQEKKMPSNILLEEFVETCIKLQDNQKALDCLWYVAEFNSTLVLQFADRIKDGLVLLPAERKKIEVCLQEDGELPLRGKLVTSQHNV